MRALGLVVVVMLGTCDRGRAPATSSATPIPHKAAHASYCPGAPSWGSDAATCTGDSDCGSDQRCWPDGMPDYSGMCGAYTPPKVDCNQDTDCGRNEVCVAAGPGPCDGTNWSCVPRCTSTSCAADEHCGKNGHCEPTSCKSGYACKPGFKCTGDAQRADPHGCQFRACWEPGGEACPAGLHCVANVGCQLFQCKTTSDCACGACFDGDCRLRPGICAAKEPPAPPPSAAPAPRPPSRE